MHHRELLDDENIFETLVKNGIPGSEAAKFCHLENDFRPASQAWRASFLERYRNCFELLI
jgi:hypothetical protein